MENLSAERAERLLVLAALAGADERRELVAELQGILGVAPDGIWGPRTEAAVLEAGLSLSLPRRLR